MWAVGLPVLGRAAAWAKYAAAAPPPPSWIRGTVHGSAGGGRGEGGESKAAEAIFGNSMKF